MSANRDAFKRSKYPNVILPLTVLRRLDCVLDPTRDKVLSTYARLKDRLDNLAPQLRSASGFAFYNTSPCNFERLLGDARSLAANLRASLNGFSDNMREVVEKFDFANTITKSPVEPLSAIPKELNERFGTDFSEEDKVFIKALEEKLAKDAALDASVKVNTPENARLTFDHVASDKIQELIDTNFKFYKQINDNAEFAGFFLDWLYERFVREDREGD